MLEAKISELTDAIERLIAAVAQAQVPQSSPVAAPEPVVEAAPVVEVEPVKTDSQPTLEELQALCMQAVRKDRANKERIQSMIAGYGGKLMKDVPEDKRAHMMDAIRGLGLV